MTINVRHGGRCCFGLTSGVGPLCSPADSCKAILMLAIHMALSALAMMVIPSLGRQMGSRTNQARNVAILGTPSPRRYTYRRT